MRVGGLAQLAEQGTHKPCVPSSSLGAATRQPPQFAELRRLYISPHSMSARISRCGPRESHPGLHPLTQQHCESANEACPSDAPAGPSAGEMGSRAHRCAPAGLHWATGSVSPAFPAVPRSLPPRRPSQSHLVGPRIAALVRPGAVSRKGAADLHSGPRPAWGAAGGTSLRRWEARPRPFACRSGVAGKGEIVGCQGEGSSSNRVNEVGRHDRRP